MSFSLKPSSFLRAFPAWCVLTTAPLAAQDPASTRPSITRLDPVVVIAPPRDHPLTQTLDPRTTVQPIPAHDGAEALRTVPGINVIRKGGTDGDPVLRGMAGSRLGVTLDGETILGGCGMRMDPPTAYVFPATFDRITILKGPQSVRHGPGLSAGLVQFEREPRVFDHPSAHLRGSLILGSFDRNDQSAEIHAGTPLGSLRISANRTAADDYSDGDGNRVHSAYLRWSTHAVLAWTPDPQTLIELSTAFSDGEAAYADRGMDGVKFARENLGLRFKRTDLTPTLSAIVGQIYHNYVDHVMDNFSLRTPPGMPMLSNPDRHTLGARGQVTLTPSQTTEINLGADTQRNRHTVRRTPAYKTLPRLRDAEFEQLGLYTDFTFTFGKSHRLLAGARLDFWHAEKFTLPPALPARFSRNDSLPAGFIRLETDIGAWTAYAGLGHAQRFPDYWEIIGGQPPKPDTTFESVTPEKTTQLDVGLLRSRGPLTASFSLFANSVDDYILTEPALPTRVRNINARTFGGEASLGYSFAEGWRTEAALAYVRGTNQTDHTPLAQMPPLEGRLALSYSAHRWTAGALWRLVAAQKRVAPGQGNIVGQDLGPSSGYGVLSLNASYQFNQQARLSAGIDNLFDRAYAEHLSKSGAAIAGYPLTTRVNEPGRNLWLKLDLTF